MPRDIISQSNSTATNPVNGNGIANVPLQTGSDISGQLGKFNKEKFLSLLEDISQPGFKPDVSTINEINNFINKFPEYAQQLRVLQGALLNNTNGIRTKSLETGEQLPDGHELAKDLANIIRKASIIMNDNSKNVFNLTKYAQKVREDKTKKKTRGNPFRVLMGKIGKLLDHGLGKKDIVRYIGKENIWDDETIDKAVDVVMEYNKKKRKKEKKFQEASIQHNIKTAARDADKSIYEYEPDFEKRSTGELMARAAWLNDLNKYNEKTPQGDGRKASDKTGVAAELKAIRAALTKRGFELNEIP